MLVGEYQQNIDPKGRMNVPTKFRGDLGASFVMTKGLDQCVFIFSLDEWTKLEQQLIGLPLSKGKNIQRFFFGSKSDCEIDKQGRVLITGALREYAGLDKEIVVVGVAKRAEIWSKEAWDKQNEQFVENPDEVIMQMEDLGI